ncbi:MAG: FtsW/RodA/SpoVE family cell cycle protein [Myxococcota bacterium]
MSSPLQRLGPGQLVPAAGVLIAGGVLMVWSASAVQAGLRFGSSTVYLWRHLEGLALGVALGAIAWRIPPSALRRAAPIAWLTAFGLLAATYSPLGLAENGARRWLSIGPLTLQPLEPAKLAVILGLSAWLARAGPRLRDWRQSLAVPALLAGGPALLLLGQPDFGGALMLAALCAALAFAAGARGSHLAIAGGIGLPLVALLAVARSYRVARLGALLDPWSDPFGSGYQLIQSLIGFGSGHLVGVGLGVGQQKLGFLPEAHTDFILSVIGEELGLVGVLGILLAFLVLGLAALGIASRARDPFAMLVATGVGAMLSVQGAVNAGVAMGVLPTTGTTLPLVSYGRSSLICSVVALGWVLSIARNPQPRSRARGGRWR